MRRRRHSSLFAFLHSCPEYDSDYCLKFDWCRHAILYHLDCCYHLFHWRPSARFVATTGHHINTKQLCFIIATDQLTAFVQSCQMFCYAVEVNWLSLNYLLQQNLLVEFMRASLWIFDSSLDLMVCGILDRVEICCYRLMNEVYLNGLWFLNLHLGMIGFDLFWCADDCLHYCLQC